MTEFFTNTDLPQNMDQGPLGSIIPAYAALLSQQGYSQQSAIFQLRFFADLNRWLHQTTASGHRSHGANNPSVSAVSSSAIPPMT